jgi:hypothetical protein
MTPLDSARCFISQRKATADRFHGSQDKPQTASAGQARTPPASMEAAASFMRHNEAITHILSNQNNDMILPH